jgi:hypothetical protein
MPKEGLCRIEAILGQPGVCPRGRCPFWERSAAGHEGSCAFDRVDFAGNPELAALLLRVRTALGRVR